MGRDQFLKLDYSAFHSYPVEGKLSTENQTGLIRGVSTHASLVCDESDSDAAIAHQHIIKAEGISHIVVRRTFKMIPFHLLTTFLNVGIALHSRHVCNHLWIL